MDDKIIKFNEKMNSIHDIFREYDEILTNLDLDTEEFIIDFSNLATLNSCHLTLLIKIIRYLKNENIKYKVVNTNDSIKSVFKITNLYQFL